MATFETMKNELDIVLTDMNKVFEREQEAAEKLNDIRVSNAKKLAELQIQLINQSAARELEIQQKSFERALREGEARGVKERQEHLLALQEIDERLARELAALEVTDVAGRNAATARANADKQAIIDAEKLRRRTDTEYRKRQKKLDDAYRKEKGKKDLEAMNSIKS